MTLKIVIGCIALNLVILPDWRTANCPWCRETEHLIELSDLDSVSSNDKLRKAIDNRIRRLEVAKEFGLINDAVFSPQNKCPALTPNSVFLRHQNASQADVISSVAATIQELRNREAAPTYPLAKVLDHKDYLGSKFSDPLLRYAIFRSTNRHDLERWSEVEEGKRRQMARDLILSQDGNICLAEIAIAALAGKLPNLRLSREDMDTLQNDTNGSLLIEALSLPRVGGVSSI